MKFKKELIELFQQQDPDGYHSTFAESAFYQEIENDGTRGGVTVEFVDHYGGEGQGDQYWTVYKFTKGGEELYVKFYGWYASYDGATYQDYRFVQPKQKMVTVYE